ncbi:MAG: GntR family transcriptional regulator [Anaerolineae bacterium]|nr:GntR family transcriptional regulator [Anaerolineae bacterium]
MYYQLVEALRDQIRSGELKPGAQLPPERDLGEQYGISRMTARQAVQYLIREDALIAKQGSGTFVAEPKLTYDPLHVLGFTEDMMRRGADATSRVIEQALVEPPPSIAKQIQLRAKERATRIVRLRLSNNVPMLLETVYVPTKRFIGLERANLAKQSLYQLMRDRYGVRVSGSHHTIEAVQAKDYETELFGMHPCMPMILLRGVTYDEADQPVEYFKAVYRGDKFQIQMDSRKSQANRAPEAKNASLMSVVMR